jgi:hypothetical protein
VAGRGVADRHLSRDHTEDALAVVCLDYTYLSDVEDAGPILVGKDSKHRWFYAMVMPTKGVGHPWSDGEQSIMALRTQVAAELSRDHGI